MLTLRPKSPAAGPTSSSLGADVEAVHLSSIQGNSPATRTIPNKPEASHDGPPLLRTLLSKPSGYESDPQNTTANHVKSCTGHEIGYLLQDTFRLGFPEGLSHFLPLGTKRQERPPFPCRAILKAQPAWTSPTLAGLPTRSIAFCDTPKIEKLHVAMCFYHCALCLMPPY